MKKLFLVLSALAAFSLSAFAKEKSFNTEISFFLDFPVTNNDVSLDVEGVTGKDSLDTNGVGCLFSGRFYRKDNGLTFLAEMGISYAESSVAGFDDNFTGFLLNGNLGIGKRFGGEKGSFIPSFIFGYHLANMESKMTYSYYTIDTEILGLALELGGNLYASYLLGEKAGICASLGLTFNLCGGGAVTYSSERYSKSYGFLVDAGTVNILPSVGFFIKA